MASTLDNSESLIILEHATATISIVRLLQAGAAPFTSSSKRLYQKAKRAVLMALQWFAISYSNFYHHSCTPALKYTNVCYLSHLSGYILSRQPFCQLQVQPENAIGPCYDHLSCSKLQRFLPDFTVSFHLCCSLPVLLLPPTCIFVTWRISSSSFRPK